MSKLPCRNPKHSKWTFLIYFHCIRINRKFISSFIVAGQLEHRWSPSAKCIYRIALFPLAHLKISIMDLIQIEVFYCQPDHNIFTHKLTFNKISGKVLFSYIWIDGNRRGFVPAVIHRMNLLCVQCPLSMSKLFHWICSVLGTFLSNLVPRCRESFVKFLVSRTCISIAPHGVNESRNVFECISVVSRNWIES